MNFKLFLYLPQTEKLSKERRIQNWERLFLSALGNKTPIRQWRFLVPQIIENAEKGWVKFLFIIIKYSSLTDVHLMNGADHGVMPVLICCNFNRDVVSSLIINRTENGWGSVCIHFTPWVPAFPKVWINFTLSQGQIVGSLGLWVWWILSSN